MESRGGEDWEDIFEEDARFWEVGELAEGSAEVGFEVGEVGLVKHLVFFLVFLFFFPIRFGSLGWRFRLVCGCGCGGGYSCGWGGKEGGRERKEAREEEEGTKGLSLQENSRLKYLIDKLAP